MLPGAPGAQLYRSNKGEVLDIIGFMSTGATIDKEQRKDYEYYLPQLTDSADIVKQKIASIRQTLNEYVASQKATGGSYDLQVTQ